MDIEKILQNIKIFYLNNLQDELTHKNLNLNSIIDKIKDNETILSESSIDIDSENTIYTDEFVYKKKWNKLHCTHKIIKVKEFINKLKFNDTSKQNILKNNLIDAIKTRKLTKKDSVNYNSETGTIISIPNLEYINNNYYFST